MGTSADRSTPHRPGIIPTITVVDDTLEMARAQIEERIAELGLNMRERG